MIPPSTFPGGGGPADVYFRNGFLVSSGEIPDREGWRRASVGRLDLLAHPETPLLVGSADGVSIALVGLAFDPELAMYEEGAVLARLLEDSAHEEAFLQTLDRLAGRFVIIRDTEAGSEVYQDAMGSRSVFYSVEGQVVAASHAELVRAALGANFADFFIPFITSRNYAQRDVKYLPGVASPYDQVLQLTPNTRLLLQARRTERFWPRTEIGERIGDETAAAVLADHLRGMAEYLGRRALRPVIGLTSGTDSRGVFAAVKDLDPYVFTYVRSEKGTAVSSKDVRAASEMTRLHGLEAHIWPILNRFTLNSADDTLSHAYRLATGYYRGVGSPWLGRLFSLGEEIRDGVFIRGFGGEVMRGFYQPLKRNIVEVNARQLSNAYDVNSGSNITRRLFEDMMHRTAFTSDRLLGYDPNDLFYWEHRMGTWGSISLTEADLAMPAMVGYNSRNLYTTFMRLSEADRASRNAFEMAAVKLAPRLAVPEQQRPAVGTSTTGQQERNHLT
ncbi:hypothetical protein PTW37_09595 [Arthrobacter agilis]|uniref:hypothetical protein n=1 Tax=Arthrobacter agilis TaxID=37921 RepID=UPI0023664F17|nr:hypothetical protein [Arthrobacter agilis]WDF32133.1 hypothetical protein PTW37_09595 [Arthrobacter agilis]